MPAKKPPPRKPPPAAADWFGELRGLKRGRYSDGPGVEASPRRDRGAACCPADARAQGPKGGG
jgi:hypothetical protein